jgi:hypothetical protein
VRDVNKTTEQYTGYRYGDTAINNYFRIFGSDAPIVRQNIRDNKEAVLWTPSNYVYGLFYGYTGVHFPNYKAGWDQADLISELRETQATHATTSGRLAYGPSGKIFESVLTNSCKGAFKKISKSDNRYSISVFSIDRQVLNSSVCD